MARRGTVTQSDITRVIKAALAAGVGREQIVGVRIDRDGATVLFGEQKPFQIETPEASNEPAAADDSWSDVDAA